MRQWACDQHALPLLYTLNVTTTQDLSLAHIQHMYSNTKGLVD